MAEVNQEVAANKPNKPNGAHQEVQQCDDLLDPATEYMEVSVWKYCVICCECMYGGTQGDPNRTSSNTRKWRCSSVQTC